MQKQTTQTLKKAFIQQAHAQKPIITLAIFLKELEDDVEMAQWIAEQYGHEYEQHIQMHMRNMLEAQLKMNGGMDAILKSIIAEVATEQDMTADEMLAKLKNPAQALSAEDEAEQATHNLLSKFKLH